MGKRKHIHTIGLSFSAFVSVCPAIFCPTHKGANDAHAGTFYKGPKSGTGNRGFGKDQRYLAKKTSSTYIWYTIRQKKLLAVFQFSNDFLF